ncbi:hypothetical protein [Vallicoccus soli]|uniref:Uncharacterized protein n=1 Tax=Vallicoccus soli TaxID=2339232 RepID=A0A3A3Z2G9_9ACTN|nr:hypothetical protein [Vallicoccus soli]RJK97634.1 hypothetical protein D5H78_01000 [Vallicoccus soli]
MDEPYGHLHWGERPRRPPAAPDPAPERPAYRVGRSRAEAVADARRARSDHLRRDRAESFDRAVAKAVEVVAREAAAVEAGGVRVARVVAEKRWIDPEQPFLAVSVQVEPPGPGGWAEEDLEAVRARVSAMALAVPGGPREVLVWIDRAASRG